MKRNIILLIVAGLILAMSFSVIVFGAESGAGSAADPLVSKSYVDDLYNRLMDKINAVSESASQTSASASQSSSDTSFVVVEVEAGQTIIGREGTEMVMRSGKNTASIPSTAGGGIVDLTSGSDISDGKTITNNHHLLFSRDDGRGVYCKNHAYVMVKGAYIIQ